MKEGERKKEIRSSMHIETFLNDIHDRLTNFKLDLKLDNSSEYVRLNACTKYKKKIALDLVRFRIL